MDFGDDDVIFDDVGIEIKEEPPVEIIDVLQNDCGSYRTITEHLIRNHEEYNNKRESTDTPDQHDVQLAVKESENAKPIVQIAQQRRLAQKRERYRKRVESETAEERSLRRKRDRTKINIEKRQKETPYERERRLKKSREHYSFIAAHQHDQHAVRLAKRRERYREKIQTETAEQRFVRQQQYAEQYAARPTPELSEEQRIHRANRQRKYYWEFKRAQIVNERANETPDQRQFRLQKDREYLKERYRRRRAIEMSKIKPKKRTAMEKVEERELRLRRRRKNYNEMKISKTLIEI